MFLKLILLGIWCYSFHVVYGMNDNVREVTVDKYFSREHLFAGDAIEMSFINMKISEDPQVKHPLLFICFVRDKPLRYIFDPVLLEHLVLDLHAAANNQDYILGPSTVDADMSSTTNTFTSTSSLSVASEQANISQHVRDQMGHMITIRSLKKRYGYHLDFKIFVDSSEMAGSYGFSFETYENVSTKVDYSFPRTNISWYWYTMSFVCYLTGLCVYVRSILIRPPYQLTDSRLMLHADCFHFLLKAMISLIILFDNAGLPNDIIMHKKTVILLISISFATIILIQSVWFTIPPWYLKKYRIYLKKHEILVFLLLWVFHMVPMQRDLFFAIVRSYNHTMETIALTEVMKSALNFRLLFFSTMALWNARDVLFRNYITARDPDERPEFESWTQFLQRYYSYTHLYLHVTYVIMIYADCWTVKYVVGMSFGLYWIAIAAVEMLSFCLWCYAVIPQLQFLKHRNDTEDQENITEHLTTKNQLHLVIEAIMWNLSKIYLIIFNTIATNISSATRGQT